MRKHKKLVSVGTNRSNVELLSVAIWHSFFGLTTILSQ